MSVPDYYELLDLGHDATQAEIVQAYRNAIAAFGEGSRAAYSLYGDAELAAIREEIEQAYNTLRHAGERRAYDARLGGRESSDNVYYLAARHAVASPCSGGQMRAIRKSRCISLQQVADAAGVSARVVQAIEEEDGDYLTAIEDLPALIRCYAEMVGCDVSDVMESYPLLNA